MDKFWVGGFSSGGVKGVSQVGLVVQFPLPSWSNENTKIQQCNNLRYFIMVMHMVVIDYETTTQYRHRYEARPNYLHVDTIQMYKFKKSQRCATSSQ